MHTLHNSPSAPICKPYTRQDNRFQSLLLQTNREFGLNRKIDPSRRLSVYIFVIRERTPSNKILFTRQNFNFGVCIARTNSSIDNCEQNFVILCWIMFADTKNINQRYVPKRFFSSNYSGYDFLISRETYSQNTWKLDWSLQCKHVLCHFKAEPNRK